MITKRAELGAYWKHEIALIAVGCPDLCHQLRAPCKAISGLGAKLSMAAMKNVLHVNR